MATTLSMQATDWTDFEVMQVLWENKAAQVDRGPAATMHVMVVKDLEV